MLIQATTNTGSKKRSETAMKLGPTAQTKMEKNIILSARALTKEFSGFVAVKNVDLDVQRNSIHAVIGPNGAGKTTFFNLLTKFLKPTSGSISFNGRDITEVAPSIIAQSGIVRSFQISAVFPHLSLLENVRIALQRKNANTFAFWRNEKTLEKHNQRALELLEAVGLANFKDVPAVEISYGRKRALELATTLALDPELMLLDEPMAGMGHEDIDRITELIRKAAVGRTVLMVEHNLKVVASLCQTITVLRRGEKLAEGSYSEIVSNHEVVEAYMGAANE
jgi:branched-chain amino acid transport system ATP-binding protein